MKRLILTVLSLIVSGQVYASVPPLDDCNEDDYKNQQEKELQERGSISSQFIQAPVVETVKQPFIKKMILDKALQDGLHNVQSHEEKVKTSQNFTSHRSCRRWEGVEPDDQIRMAKEKKKQDEEDIAEHGGEGRLVHRLSFGHMDFDRVEWVFDKK